MSRLLDRFYRYIAVDTMSDPESTTVPSTAKQFDLAKLIVEEFKAAGLKAEMDDHAYVYAELPANLPEGRKAPDIALIAHIDTSPALDGKCVNPQVLRFEGQPLKLNEQFSLDPAEFPALNELVGKELICTDGTTLLGADDKAGVVSAMEALFYLQEHPEIPHGRVVFCATPDEEIGHGAALLDLEKIHVDFAYTIDGGELGELEYETFNACSAKLHFQGKSVHPGSAKNCMINAIELAMEFDRLLPAAEKPQHTEGYEGFYMPEELKAGIDSADMHYIIRDHSRERFNERKAFMQKAADFLNAKYGKFGKVCELELKDSYYNMREVIEKHMEIVDLAREAMERLGIEVKTVPVRGGTDGSQLSFRGLPCPNVFAGGYNFHGRFEFIPLENLEKCFLTCVEILKLAAEKGC